MEDYLLHTLDQEERVRLKLLNPLNVGLRLAARYKEAAFERLKLLAQDVEALQNIDGQLALFHQEMLRDFEPRLARLDVLLGDMERRGLRFFEETIRIGRIRTLLDSEARETRLRARGHRRHAGRRSRRRWAASSTGSSSGTSRSGRT